VCIITTLRQGNRFSRTLHLNADLLFNVVLVHNVLEATPFEPGFSKKNCSWISLLRSKSLFEKGRNIS
jgi:hypothetical protein